VTICTGRCRQAHDVLAQVGLDRADAGDSRRCLAHLLVTIDFDFTTLSRCVAGRLSRMCWLASADFERIKPHALAEILAFKLDQQFCPIGDCVM